MSHSGDQNRWVDFRSIKEAVSLEAVLEHYEVKNLRRRRRDQLEGCCPLHGGERQDALPGQPEQERISLLCLRRQGKRLGLRRRDGEVFDSGSGAEAAGMVRTAWNRTRG